MSEQNFDKDTLNMMYRISKLNPFKLLQYLEEAYCYATTDIVVRKRAIRDEVHHLREEGKICVSSSQKYIKQMIREIRVCEERIETLSCIIKQIKSGAFIEEG